MAFKPTHKRATIQECEDFKFKHLNWDFENNKLITDDADLLAEECITKGYLLTIDEDVIEIWKPIMEDDSLVRDDDLDTSSIDEKSEVNNLDELYNTLKEDLSKQVADLSKKLEGSIKDLINKNKLVTEETFVRFAQRLTTELNEKFDEIKGSIQKKEEGREPRKEV